MSHDRARVAWQRVRIHDKASDHVELFCALLRSQVAPLHRNSTVFSEWYSAVLFSRYAVEFLKEVLRSHSIETHLYWVSCEYQMIRL